MTKSAKREEIKLSADLKYWRAERPDEWTMDEFIRKAYRLESINSDLLQASKDIEAMLNAGFDASVVMDENSPMRDAMRDAIRKAEGGAV